MVDVIDTCKITTPVDSRKFVRKSGIESLKLITPQNLSITLSNLAGCVQQFKKGKKQQFWKYLKNSHFRRQKSKLDFFLQRNCFSFQEKKVTTFRIGVDVLLAVLEGKNANILEKSR